MAASIIELHAHRHQMGMANCMHMPPKTLVGVKNKQSEGMQSAWHVPMQVSEQACTSTTSGSRPIAALLAAALSSSQHSAACSCASSETTYGNYPCQT